MQNDEMFKRLTDFQEILTKRITIEHDIEDIPKAILTQEELLSRIKKTYTEQHAEFLKIEENISDLRARLGTAEASREHAEKQMDVISTQREYEALHREINIAKDNEQQYRKDLQREGHRLAELEENLRRNESMIKSQEAEIAEKTAKINAERATKLSEVEQLRQEEVTVVQGIPKDTLFKFERIIRSKAGQGIVAVRGHICSGCFMVLPSQFVNEVRANNAINFCPYCSRVLFYEESTDADEQLLIDIESGSLADLDDNTYDDEDLDDDDFADGEKASAMDEQE